MTFLYLVLILLNGALLVGLLVGWYRCLQVFARQYSRSGSIALCLVTLMTCTSSKESVRAPERLTAIAPVYLPIKHPVLYISYSTFQWLPCRSTFD